MQDTGIFKWVWRFNAVVIALGAVLLVLLVGSEVLRPMFRAAPLEAVEVEPMPDAPPQLSYGTPELGAGGLIILPVEQGHDSRDSYSSKYGAVSVVNYSFLPVQGPQRWFFAGNRQLVVSEQGLRRPKDQALLARVLAVAAKDTDGDGRLTPEDAQHLLLTNADLQNPVLLAEGIKRLVLADFIADDGALVMIETEKGLEALRIALPSGQLIGRQSLAAPEAAK